VDTPTEKGFLVGVELKRRKELWRVEDSLEELAQLARTARIEVVGNTIQRLNAPNPATFVRSGKVEELRAWQRELGYDVLLFDDELRPRQQRNLEEELDVKVVDRTALILDIFADHARTKEGRLQVELAQYQYRLPRLTRMWTHLSRQGVGGVGLRGPGETQLESDKREIGRRISQLKRQLEEIRTHRRQYRRRREKAAIPVVAIVGYTNAGKSTLLNSLSGAEVLVEDKLFATLDPTTRRVTLPGGTPALFTDTVGFIHKLPTQLVAAFRATLEEINEADMLLHIVDITHDAVREQAATVERVLRDLGAGDKPVVTALNKIDLLMDTRHGETGEGAGESLAESDVVGQVREFMVAYPNCVAISAEKRIGLGELLEGVDQVLDKGLRSFSILLPYSNDGLLNLIHEEGIVERQEYGEQGIRIEGRLPERLVHRFEPYLVGGTS
jgi:GTP-binding protein HflX